MQKFETLTAKSAPLPIQNVDTDMIIPKQFLKTIKRTGLKEGLFFEMRYDMNGNPVKDFILNDPTYDGAQVLVSLDNFGCGSSREHAPWALLDQGFRCVIAPSYADIFYNNCFKNGILPIVLPKDAVNNLLEYAKTGAPISIDLPNQTVKAGNHAFTFDVDAHRKRCLIGGLDDIGLTLEKSDAINAFEQKRASTQPWLAA